MSEENKVIEKKYTPLFSNIVVVIVQGPTAKYGNLAIPETAKDKLTTPICRVVAIGPEVKYVKEGDLILCHPRIETATVFYDGDETLITSESSVFGYIDKYRTEPEKETSV